MNEKKAKALRKQIYGEQSLKVKTHKTVAVGYFKSATRFIQCGSSVVCTGLRRQYQDAKRAMRNAT